MTKISIQLTGKCLVVRKGMGQVTIPLEGAGGEKAERAKKIYYVGQETAEKIRPGITTITHRERSGTVVSRPVYKKYLNYGFWYAVVKWEDGVVENFNLNKMGIEIEL